MPSVLLLCCCCCCSVSQSCPTLCDSMNCSIPGFAVLHYLSEFAQNHVCWIGDAIQPSHPFLLPSPPALNLSQNQGLFQWLNSLHQVAKVLEFQLQHQYFQWIFRTDFLLRLTGLISLLSKWLASLLQHCSSKVSILRYLAFFMVRLSHPYRTTGKNNSFD